jgi:hypothetical protein
MLYTNCQNRIYSTPENSVPGKQVLTMDDSHIRQEINKYKKFKKVDGATYRKVNQFLRKRTYITAREWALARLCTDFRTSGGAEMTFIGKHLPELVPFMEDTYSPQAVNQARNSFKKKVRKASATFFYGAMCGFFTTDELDDLLFEASEVARFLLEVEGTTLDIDEEIDIEDRITKVMRSVGEAAKTILKSRAEEGESADHVDVPSSQKSVARSNSHLHDIAGKEEKGADDKAMEAHDPVRGDHDQETIITEVLPDIDKKIALDGSISTVFVSGKIPDNRIREKIPDTVKGEIEKQPPGK